MDMRPIQAHNRAMQSIENDVLRELAEEWRTAYPELSAAILRGGMKSPGLIAEVTAIIDAVGARLTRTMAEAAPMIDRQADNLVQAQVGPEVARAAAAAADRPRVPTAQDWTLAARARYMSDIQRLQNELPEDAIAALMARSPAAAGGRQSTFDALANLLASWGQQQVWRYANSYMQSQQQAVNRVDSVQYQRQAVAAIDGRTTSCCLNVHGQIVDLNKPFRLTGTPHFSSEMMNPPFHWSCRTATVLYRPEMEATGLSTADMRARARAEERRRAEEKRRPKPKKPVTRPAARPAPTGTAGRRLEPWRYDPKLSAEENEARRLQWTWVHGSNSKNGVLLKTAVRDELGVRGLLHNPRGHVPAAGDISKARGGVRLMYENTQEYYRRRGIREVTLYRGVKSNVTTPGVAESWTSDPKIAEKFDGHTVLKETIPVDRLLTAHEVPGWRNGWYGQQSEYLVLP